MCLVRPECRCIWFIPGMYIVVGQNGVFMQSNLVSDNGPQNVPSQMNDIHNIRAAAADATSNIAQLLLVDFDPGPIRTGTLRLRVRKALIQHESIIFYPSFELLFGNPRLCVLKALNQRESLLCTNSISKEPGSL